MGLERMNIPHKALAECQVHSSTQCVLTVISIISLLAAGVIKK